MRKIFLIIIAILFLASSTWAGFGGVLKEDTAVDVLIGPFIDDTDGKTAETALTLSQADIKLSKNGQTLAQKTDVTAAAHDANGYYNCEFDATDTGTPGQLTLIVHETGALPVRIDFQIVDEIVYDSLYAQAATDYLPIDVIQLGGVTQSGTDLKDFADAGFDPTSNGVLLQDGTGTGQIDLDAGTVLLRSATETQIDNIETDTGTTLENRLIAIEADTNATLVDTSTTLENRLATVETDTNELQTNQGNWATATGFSTLVASDNIGINWGDVSNPTTTLNLSGTTIKTATDVETDTTVIGALGAGLTAIPWNSSWDAEVESEVDDSIGGGNGTALTDIPWNSAWDTDAQSECNDAMVALHLDHLLAADTGAAPLVGVAGSVWHDLLEDDGGTWRYTTNALEQAPSGGTNPNVLISTTIASVTDQTHFTLTAGSTDNDAYKDQAVTVYDANNSDYPSVRVADSYNGTTKTITLDSAPDFTIVNGDGVKIFVTAPGTTAPTAAAIVNEWEAQSQADPTGFHVNVHEIGGTTQTANDNGADINAVLTDTGTTLDTLIKDIPTVAEFNARSIVSADYVVTGDTIAGVTTVTNLTNAPTSGNFTATMKLSINTEVDNALDTAIPAAPTDGSINSQIKRLSR